MVTGAKEKNVKCHNMTEVHEEVTYCPPNTSSGKQKKNRSTRQPQFRSENTPATIEADQILLAFSSWQLIIILRTFTKLSAEFPNCRSH